MTTFGKFFNIAFIVFLTYFICLVIYYFILGIIGLFEDIRRRREDEEEFYSLFSVSSFTLPVSIIIPAHNEEEWILDSVRSILNLNYPEFEVIIVNDGSTDKTMELLKCALKLKHVSSPYMDRFSSGKLLGLFKSEERPNVTVINKTDGYKKAGAINAGLNLAKYKYVCVIDSDTVLEPEALMKVMAHVEKDPERIIGIGSYFGLVNGFKIKDGKIVERSFSRKPIVAYQNLEYIRSFIGNRMAWSRFNSMPIVSGGFGLWRRDILLELGGYAPEFSSEDLEFTFRAHDYIIKNHKKGYKILMLPYYAGWTDGPSNIRSLIQQRNRWQRVVNEAIWQYRHMILNPRYGIFAFFTLPYYVFYEVLGVFFEISSILITALGWLMGILDVKIFLGFLLLIILSLALISLLSLFAFSRNQKIFKLKDTSYFVVLSFLEFFWYRWIVFIAKICGTYDYLRGNRESTKYVRVR